MSNLKISKLPGVAEDRYVEESLYDIYEQLKRVFTDEWTYAGDVTFEGAMTFEGEVTFDDITTFNSKVTINDSLDVLMTEASDRFLISQSSTTGTAGQSLIFINDDRTGVTADAKEEAAVRIDAEGGFALYIEDGQTYFNDQVFFNSSVSVLNDVAFSWGAGNAMVIQHIENSNGDDINLWRLATAADHTGALIFSDEDFTLFPNMSDWDGYLSPTMVFVNHEGADTWDFTSVEIGEHTQANVAIAHYFDFFATTGARDGTPDGTTTELEAIFRFGNNRSTTPDNATTGGDVFMTGALEVDGIIYADGGATLGGNLAMGSNDITGLNDIGMSGDITITSAADRSITWSGGTEGGVLTWLEDEGSLNLKAGGASSFNITGVTSAFLVNSKPQSTNDVRTASNTWITADSDQSSSGQMIGYQGGYYDSGASSESVALAGGTLGYNYLTATDARTIATLFSVGAENVVNIASGTGPTITDVYGMYIIPISKVSSVAPSITNIYGLYIFNSIGVTATTNYGLYIADQTVGSTDWAIYSLGADSYHAGKIAFRTDKNEYITGDLVDGELDVEATTSFNVRINTAEEYQFSATQADFKSNNLTTTGSGRFDGHIGIGTAAHTGRGIDIGGTIELDEQGISLNVLRSYDPTGAGNPFTGAAIKVGLVNSSEDVATLKGTSTTLNVVGNSGYTGTVTEGTVADVSMTFAGNVSGGDPTMTTGWMLRVNNAGIGLGSSIGTLYALDLKEQTVASTNWQIYSRGGNSYFAGKNLYGQTDGTIGIYSQADSFLDLFADGAVRIGDSSAGAPSHYLNIDTSADSGDMWWVGSGSGLPYGGMFAEDGSGTVVLGSQDTFVQVLVFDNDGESNLTTPENANDHIIISKTGRYLLQFSISFFSNTSNEYDFHIQKNNGATDFPQTSGHRTTSVAGATGNCSGQGIADLTAADTIELWVERLDGAAVSKTITIPAVSLTVFMLGG